LHLPDGTATVVVVSDVVVVVSDVVVVVVVSDVDVVDVVVVVVVVAVPMHNYKNISINNNEKLHRAEMELVCF
jgi:hypothetical protein